MTVAQKTGRRRGPPDALAGRLPAAALPDAPAPMLCTLVAEPFDHPAWVFEPKFDGLRVLARFDGEELVLLSRNNQSQNVQFPDVVEALRAALTRPALVDGEVVCFDDEGRTSFRALQQRFHVKDPGEVRARMARHPAYVFLFDILYLDRYDLTKLPLSERKPLLREAVRWSDRVRWTEYTEKEGKALWRQACREGNEGVIGKHRNSLYVAGRSDWWVKVKCIGRQEFVIGGFTDPQGTRVGLGALLVGYFEANDFVFAGKIGTGFDTKLLLDLRARLERYLEITQLEVSEACRSISKSLMISVRCASSLLNSQRPFPLLASQPIGHCRMTLPMTKADSQSAPVSAVTPPPSV